MVELLFSLGRLAAALFLVVLNGFFVASEFAFVRVRSTSVDQMVEEGRAGAGVLQDALEHLDDYLAATQLGITVASLSLGWIGEPAVAALLEPLLGSVLPAGTTHLIAVVIGFSVVTFLHVVFGELAPKTLAIADAERIAILCAPPMKVFYYVFLPGLYVFNGTANWFTSLIGVPPASETEETLSEEEIRMVLARSGDEGHVDAGEVEMIERVFDLDDITARSVMVPRPDLVSVPADEPLSAVRPLVVEHGHTRYPVVDPETGDEPVGYVDVKDVLRAGDGDANGSVTVGDVAREMPVVPETMGVDDLLGEFQSQQRQMAAVVDEYGSLAGIATVEDAVEVVVGEIRDDFDEATAEREIRRRDDGAYVAGGSVPIPEVNDVLDSDFEVGAYGTIGGLVFDRLGHPPAAGDSVRAGGFDIEVTAVDGARIESVVVTAAADDANSTSDE
ncbi:hemolysin family protein [Halorubellus salinus]|uniref:hemolysin family protein n=1 Tax=Halorubellus salinus TaxID=755309 RepID=UPI001D078A61|nr:hemolysin family protein [Halorubellus salinus]